MIIVFHGEDQPSLREGLRRLRAEYAGSRFWDQKLSELSAYLKAPTFFAAPQKKELIVVEDPRLNELEADRLKAWGREEKDIALIFSRRLNATEISRFSGVQVRGFSPQVPKSVFPFLDALVTRRRADALAEAHRLLREGNDLDFILNMITWQLRNLARVKGGAVKGMKRYTIEKLRRAAHHWSEADLQAAFKTLLEEDRRRKRGSRVPLDFLIHRLTR